MALGKVVSIFYCCFNGFLSFTDSQLENFLTVITDWDVDEAHSRLEDGMKYSNGRLTVPQDGEYYVYAQLYFRSGGRVEVRKNHREIITMVQHPYNVAAGPHYAGGAFYFEANDTIELLTTTPVTLFIATAHSYFGAFLIEWASPQKARKALKEIVTRYQ